MAGFSSGSVTSQSGKLSFGSAVQATVVLPAVVASLSLPSITIAAVDLPSNLTITRVIAAIAWRKGVESSAVANAINGAQQIQARKSGSVSFIDAITIADNSLAHGGSATEGGLMLLGDSDISSEVDGAGTYQFQWTSALVDGASLTLHDVQTYLLIEHT